MTRPAAGSVVIEHIRSEDLSPDSWDGIVSLCDEAFEQPTSPSFADVGPGEHLLGLRDGRLVSHLMWVTRWLQPDGMRPLRTAYVELVATAPNARRLGYATALLERFVPVAAAYELAALSTGTPALYFPLGWRPWRGPLAARRADGLVPTPDEGVMVLPLPATPELDLDAPLSVEWRRGEVW